MGIEYSRHMKTMTDGTARVQKEILEAETAGRVFKNFAPAVIPGKFQTQDYATTRLTEARELLSLPDTVAQTVELRMARGRLLDDPERTFHAVIAEHVLYGATANPDVMAAQLEHLIALAGKPNVRLGILPMRARVAASPMTHIDIVDDTTVTIETMAVTYKITEAPEVGMYLHMFDTFAQAALYEQAAEALVRTALTELS